MPTPSGPFDLTTTYLRLRNDSLVEPLPVTPDFWQRLGSGALGTFKNERLVTTHTYNKPWTVAEMHPNGDEIVCLLSGSVTFVLETPDGEKTVELREPGAYVIVPQGTWHTARTHEPCRMLFITAGEGTQHKKIA